MSDNLTSKTFNGFKWSYLSTGINAVLQIGFTAVMARLLEPAVFGLFAMAGLVLRFGQYFSQMGIGQALIQTIELKEEDIRAGFTLAFILGTFFTVITFFIAPLGILLFNNIEVIIIIRVMGLSFLLNGLSTISLSLMKREFKFKQIAIIEIITYVVGYGIIGLGMAYYRFGVWSLVGASLSQALIYTVISYIVERHSISFCFNTVKLKKIMTFGGKVAFIGFWEFIGNGIDVLMIGHFLGPFTLGIYNRSCALVNLPIQYVSSTFAKVFYSAFARVQNDNSRMKTAYLSSLTVVSLIIIPVSMGIIPAAKEIITTMLGTKWLEGVVVLQVLAVSVPFNVMIILPSIVCETRNKLNYQFAIQIIFVISMAGLIGFTFKYGLTAIALSVATANFIRFIIFQALMVKHKIAQGKEIMKALLPGVVISFFVVSCIVILKYYAENMNSLILLIMEIVTGSVVFLFFIFIRPPFSLSITIKNILKNLFDKPASTKLTRFLFRHYGLES